MVTFFHGATGGSLEVFNMPANKIAFIQTDADVDIAWWDRKTQSYGAVQTIVPPGDEVSCPNYRAQLTGEANIAIRLGR